MKATTSLLAALALTAAASVAPPRPSRDLVRVLANPARHGDARLDARRHPAEVMMLPGAKPGDRVVDLIPVGGYFTRILAKPFGPNGHVYVLWPMEYAREARTDVLNSVTLTQKLGFANVSVIGQSAAAFVAPEPLDLLFTSQNYHDYDDRFMSRVGAANFARMVFRALKPGGTFLMIDHAAAAGAGLRDTETLHRIDPAIVRREASAAGFGFAGASGALRNPADDHRKAIFDPVLRGHTDQFMYKFVKPARGRLRHP